MADGVPQNGRLRPEREPYVAHIDGTDVARHVRVQMDASDYIYFSECQVFGERAESSVLERFRKAEEAIAEYGTHAREGSFATIGEFEIFIDRGRYSPRMISALTTPYYDQAARNLRAPTRGLQRSRYRHRNRRRRYGDDCGLIGRRGERARIRSESAPHRRCPEELSS